MREEKDLMTMLEAYVIKEYNSSDIITVKAQSFDSIINSTDELEEKLGKEKFRRAFPLFSVLKAVLANSLDEDVSLNDLEIAYINYSMLSRLFPENKLIEFWYIKLRIQIFKKGDYFDNDLVSFYKDVITDFDFIFDLDNIIIEEYNFCAETDLFSINNTAEFWRQDAILEMFEKAVENKPSNILFVNRLATIYSIRNEYKNIFAILNKCLDLNMDVANTKTKCSAKYKSYIRLNELTAMAYFATNQFDTAKELVDYILNNLPNQGLKALEKHFKTREHESELPILKNEVYIKSLLIRMSINKKNKNIDEFKADLEILKNERIIKLQEWKEWFPLIAKYIIPSMENDMA